MPIYDQRPAIRAPSPYGMVPKMRYIVQFRVEAQIVRYIMQIQPLWPFWGHRLVHVSLIFSISLSSH